MNILKKSFIWRQLLPSAIFLLAIGFFINNANRNFSNIPPINIGFSSIAVGIFTVALVMVGIIIVGTIWYLLLLDNGLSPSWRQAQTIFAIAQFGKYLPGNVGQHVGRVIMSRAIGIPVPVTLNTMFVEMIWGVGIAGGFSFLSLILFFDGQAIGLELQLNSAQIGFGVILILFSPWIIIGCTNRYLPWLAKRFYKGEKILAPRLSTALVVAVLFLLCFLIVGIILKLQAIWFFGVTDGSVFELTCLFSIAWLAGYLVPGAPGGLGVREAIMLLVLSPVLGTGTVVALGITLRITTTVGDAISFILGLVIKHFITEEFNCCPE